MPLKLWTYDIAREQSPSPEFLDRLARMTLDAGYDGIGLYLEHRFAYDSVPWGQGIGALTPEEVARLRRDFPSLRVIPFINLLGHTEGLLYTERGKRYAEERFKGLQACPSHQGFQTLAKGMLEDTLRAFDDEMIHLGGDETAQLGKCPTCASGDKSELYAEFFAPLCESAVRAGRQPGLWGDMFLEHPQALRAMPRESIIFDWQYFDSPLRTTRTFQDSGFEAVCCPTLHTYNSTWLNVDQAQENVREAHEVAKQLKAGLCVTTWECGLFGDYETLLPAIAWASTAEGPLVDAYEEETEWARIMGRELVDLGGMFVAGKIRSSLRCRLLLYGNPFLAWLHHAEELTGPVGDQALDIAERGIQHGETSSTRGVAGFLKLAIQFVRLADQARQAYAQDLAGLACSTLAPCRQIFDELEKIATAKQLNSGGSLADVERCRQAKRHVEEVILRIRTYGSGQMGYRPSFEAITHHQFCPHDQGCWWRINSWGSE